MRFYLDLYWIDPRMIGQKRVPEGIWRPADCYVINQHGEMSRILHDDRPTLIDSETGMLLWPVELVGEIQNPMRLQKFPFDADAIELHIHQVARSGERRVVRSEWRVSSRPPEGLGLGLGCEHLYGQFVSTSH